MDNNKPKAFTRFTLSIICHNCGLYGQVMMSWFPEMKLGSKCFRCGNEEMVSLAPDKPDEANFTLNFSPEEVDVIKEIAKKRKEKPEVN